MATVRPYGQLGCQMLEELRQADLLKVEALCEWLAGRGLNVDRTLVSHWCAGRSHLPADLLPLLAEFSGRPDLVYGPFVHAAGYELFALPAVEGELPELVDLTLQVGAHLGRLQHALFAARAPESPGGGAVTREEATALCREVDDLVTHLAELRAHLLARTARRARPR